MTAYSKMYFRTADKAYANRRLGDRFGTALTLGEERATVTSRKIAVLVPAHNEEDNLPLSLPGAVEQAGPENVYVVDDNSSDSTARVALNYTRNVYSTARGGKAATVMAGIERFGLLDNYKGVLVLDADSRLMPGAMVCYEGELAEGVAAVIGHLRVLSFQKAAIAGWRRHLYFYMTSGYLMGATGYGGGFRLTPGFGAF